MKLTKNDYFNLMSVVIYFAAHLYIVWQINYGFQVQSPYEYVTGGVIFFMAALSVLSLISIKIRLPDFAGFIYRMGQAWMGIFAITAVCLLANEILNSILNTDVAFRFWSTASALAISAALCVWSGVNVGFLLRVKKLHIGVENLKVDRLRLVFIADTHINKYTPFRKINKLVDKINLLMPDIFLLGGDFSDDDINETYKLYGLEKLNAKYGMFAVTGNHEYHLGVEKYVSLCEKLGIRVLRNESVSAGGLVNVAGINDEFGEKLGKDISDVKKALEKIDPELPVILLSHKPDPFKEAVKESRGIKLVQLSGHTHGGQIPPMGIVGSLFFRYYYGKWEKENSAIYITSGAGWWGPPMRLFNVAEIAEIILYRKNK